MSDRIDVLQDYERWEDAALEAHLSSGMVKEWYEQKFAQSPPPFLICQDIDWDPAFEFNLGIMLALYAGAISRHDADGLLGVQLEMDIDLFKEHFPDTPVPDSAEYLERVMLTHVFETLPAVITSPVNEGELAKDNILGELNEMSPLEQLIFFMHYLRHGVWLRMYTSYMDGNTEMMLSCDLEITERGLLGEITNLPVE